MKNKLIRVAMIIFPLLIITIIFILIISEKDEEIVLDNTGVYRVVESNTIQTTSAKETETCTQEREWKPYDFIPLDYELQRYIHNLCEKYNISYILILAIIKTESEFDVNCIGDNGNSIGLMQIQPKWWQNIADQYNLNIWVPEDNVHLGILIITNLLNANNGDLDKALKQYNSGNPDFYSDRYINMVFENIKEIGGRVNDNN